jgi:hypothetical protein
MLQIHIQNTPLDLSEDTQIRVEENFPYFDSEGIPVSTVWSFDLPVTPNNEKLFNYSNYVMVRKKVRMYDAGISVHGIPIGKGKLTLTNTTETTFRGSMLLNDFAVDFEDVMMSDTETKINLGINQTTRLKNAWRVNHGDVPAPVRFPMVYAPKWYGDVDEDTGKSENNLYYKGYLNYVTLGTQEFKANNGGKNYNTLVPFVLLKDGIEDILKTKRWTLTGAVADNYFFKNLLMHNNHSLDETIISDYAKVGLLKDKTIGYANTDGDVFYFPFNFDLIYKDDQNCHFDVHYLVKTNGNYIVKGFVDAYLHADGSETFVLEILRNNAAIYTSDPVTIEKLETKTFTIPDFLLYCNAGDVFSPRIKVPKHHRSFTLYIKSSSVVEYEKEVSTNNKHTSITLSNHMPDIEFTTLLNNTRLMLGAVCFFDNTYHKVEMAFLNDILADKNNAYDITQYSIPSEVETEIIEPESIIYTFKEETEYPTSYKFEKDYSFDLPDTFYKNEMYAYLKDEFGIYKSVTDEENHSFKWEHYAHDYRKSLSKTKGEEREIKLELLPCSIVTANTTATGKVRVFPYYEEEGNSPYNDKEPDPMELVLSVWIGTHAGLPTATSVGTMVHRWAINGTINFNTENSLDSFVRPFADWQEKREEITVPMTGIGVWEMLEILQMNRPTREDNPQPRWIAYKGMHCLPKQASFIIDVHGNIKESEIVIVKKREE